MFLVSLLVCLLDLQCFDNYRDYVFLFLIFCSVLLLCAAQNNCNTRHLTKILIHLSWCLQECVSNSGAPSEVYEKAVNAVYISSVFLKYLIENAQSNSIEEFHLSLNESEPAPNGFETGTLFCYIKYFISRRPAILISL